MKTENHDAIILSSNQEKDDLSILTDLQKNSPVPDDEKLANIGLFLTSKNLSRLLFFNEIYKKVINTHGVIMEFGVRWGQTLSILSALRGIYEPFNRHRKIIGFDTFEGFKGIDKEKDGNLNKCKEGSYSVKSGYEADLNQILQIQENLNPMSHIKKFSLEKGDASETIPKYFQKHPETIVSLAILDFDIYKPTKIALENIKPHLCKGSIIVFDELCDEYFPGETLALQEVFGINNVRIQRSQHTARVSYCVIE